jgi:hypothetical protein
MRRFFVLVVVAVVLVGCGGGGGASLTPQQVVDGFTAAGLKAANAKSMAATDYGMAPMVGSGLLIEVDGCKTATTCRARVIAVDDAGDRARLADYYTSLGKQSAAFFSWVFEHKGVVLQINGDVAEETARRYEAALKGL